MHISNPPPPHITIDIPSDAPPATPGGPQSRSEKVAAWAGAAGQQAVVSGLSWGFANKLPVAIGTTVGAMAGGPAGAAGGAVVGNLIGGTLLGITHYSAEVACNNTRVKMGNGFQYQPDPGADSKKFTYNSFIGTFSTIGGLKGLAKAGVEANIGDGKDWAKTFTNLAVDMASSTAGGAIAQTITNDRQHLVGSDGFNSEIKYKELKEKKFDWNEAKTRMKGGTATGASGSLFDFADSLKQSPASSGASMVAGMALGAAETSLMVHTWFNALETFASTPRPEGQPAPAASTASTSAAPPTTPAAVSTSTGASERV
ncbi:MAG: hypothetical protein P8Y45_12755 [Exilibacterium sp.]